MSTAQTAQRLQTLGEQIRQCTQCPLHTSRTIAVPGDGKPSAQVMLIGEAPGKEEDKHGMPFVGAAGRVLNRLLAARAIDREALFITNIVKCRPPNNRTPRQHEIATCTTQYLFAQIDLIRPRVIVLLGSVAARTLLEVPSVREARGQLIERHERKYIVTYHPAAAFYRQELTEKVEEDFTLLQHTLHSD